MLFQDRTERFQDRTEAGQFLASRLTTYANRPDVVVLGLPRGGVPVAFEVAKALQAPLDVFLVRKLGVPGQEELAMGAIAPGGVLVLNDRVVESMHMGDDAIERVMEKERQELERRQQLYRGDRPLPELQNRIVILVDDGLATGSTMRAAVSAIRREHPARIIIAVPVSALSTCQELQSEVDEIVCTYTPNPFFAVGLGYKQFDQTSDQEVRDLLQQAAEQLTASH